MYTSIMSTAEPLHPIRRVCVYVCVCVCKTNLLNVACEQDRITGDSRRLGAVDPPIYPAPDDLKL